MIFTEGPIRPGPQILTGPQPRANAPEIQYSSSLQFAHVGYFSGGDGPELRRQQRHHRHRLSSQSYEFHLIASSTFMNMHDCANVAGFQALGGQVLGENHAIVFLDHDPKG